MLGSVPFDEVTTRVFDSFWLKLRPAIRHWRWSALLATFVGAAHLARWGTVSGRMAGVGLLVSCGLWFAYSWYRAKERAKHPEAELRRIVARIDRPLAERLERAFELLARTEDGDGQVSVELSRLHLSRLLEQIPFGAVAKLGERRANRVRNVTFLLVTSCLAAIAFDPARVIEGANVALSRRGYAPFDSTWITLEPVTVLAPPYLREPAEFIDFDASASVAKGSVLTIHGLARLSGRKLLLTDGKREIAFVSDGQGGVIARYVVDRNATVFVAARFGKVLVRQSPALELRAIDDAPPEVELEGAPKRIGIDKIADVPLKYRVRDDHGIVQVELILRSGAEQDTRRLVQFSQPTLRYEGTTILKTDDPFIVQGTGSIELQVLARDNNGVDGPKTSVSRSLWLDKPSIGSVQVEQHKALVELRSVLVDWYDAVHRRRELKSGEPDYSAQALDAQKRYFDSVGSSGKRSQWVRNFLRAQLDKLSKGGKFVGPSEGLLIEALLSIDALVEASSQRDAELVSRQLAQIAEEIEAGAKELEQAERRDIAYRTVQGARDRLRSGALMLSSLGPLGADLGGIALSGVTRISRAAQQNDYKNVERAASFLAERLNRPVPSFVGGLRPTVEGGTQRSGPGSSTGHSGRPSEADTRFERVTNELRQLAEEHATLTESVRQLDQEFEKSLGSEEAFPEALLRAAELRRLVANLPNVGEEPGSPRASAALAKELTYGAAESLSRRHLVAALDGLRQADDALSEAERMLLSLDPSAMKELAEYRRIRAQLADHKRWLEGELDRLRQQSRRKSAEAFRELATKERELAERAQTIAARESKDDAVLPEDYREDLTQAAKLMNEATRALDGAKGPQALDRQQRAQQLLERSDWGDNDDAKTSEPATAEGGPGRPKSGGEGTVTVTSDNEAREQFRRRVLEGLGKDLPPETAVKVRRYVEGLLR